MKALVGVAISTVNDPDTQYVVNQKHYEFLKKSLDENDKGWVELDSAIEGGKLFIKLENIAEIFLSSEEYVENFEDRKREATLE
jgi:frataxin-like iron-binding protein CyaY